MSIIPTAEYIDYYRSLLEKYYGKQGSEYVDSRLQGKLNSIERKGELRLVELKGILELEGKKILDVGAGMGEFVCSSVNEGVDAYGIEPDYQKVTIANNMIGASRLGVGLGDSIQFRDNTFDVVTSYEVLEHVQNHYGVLREMVRVTKIGGFIYLKCPNYLSCTEGHYKVKYFPPVGPKWMGAFVLWLRGKDTLYWNECVFPINHLKLKSIMRKLPVTITDLVAQKGDSSNDSAIRIMKRRLQRPFGTVDEFLLQKISD